MKEYLERLLLTYKINRQRDDFESEIREVYGSKIKSRKPLYITIAIVLALCGLAAFFTLKVAKTKKNVTEKAETEIVVEAIPKVEEIKDVPEIKPEIILPPVETPPEDVPPSVKKSPVQDVAPTEAIVRPVLEALENETLVYASNNVLKPVIGSLNKGDIVELVKEGETWHKLRDAERKIGWIKADEGKVFDSEKELVLYSPPIEKKVDDQLLLVKKFLDGWINAYEAKDIDRFTAFYDEAYETSNMDFDSWRLRKREIFKNARFILVGVKDIEIIESNENLVKVAFTQYYNNSDRLKTTNFKVMMLKKYGDSFKIYRERLK